MLRPLLSCFNSAELDDEVEENWENFVKPVPELMTNIYVKNGWKRVRGISNASLKNTYQIHKPRKKKREYRNNQSCCKKRNLQ